jgi:transcriptional regulator with GAF, ATPase, and Fis domain
VPQLPANLIENELFGHERGYVISFLRIWLHL